MLVRRADLDRVTAVLAELGFRRQDLRSPVVSVDPAEPSRRAGVHLVCAGELIRPSHAHTAPDVAEVTRALGPFAVLELAALVRMKLTSLRDIDRVHIADLLRVGLVSDPIRAALPEDLQARLAQVEAGLGDELTT